MATTKTTIRDLVIASNPRHYSEREPSYEFTDRKFTKPQQTNIVKASND